MEIVLSRVECIAADLRSRPALGPWLKQHMTGEHENGREIATHANNDKHVKDCTFGHHVGSLDGPVHVSRASQS